MPFENSNGTGLRYMGQKHLDYISRELSRDLKILRKWGLVTSILCFIKNFATSYTMGLVLSWESSVIPPRLMGQGPSGLEAQFTVQGSDRIVTQGKVMGIHPVGTTSFSFSVRQPRGSLDLSAGQPVPWRHPLLILLFKDKIILDQKFFNF